MAEDIVTLTIQYVNGKEQKFEVPRRKDDPALASRIQEALNANQLLIALEDRALVIPFHNIQCIEVSPPPSKLPGSAVRDARAVR